MTLPSSSASSSAATAVFSQRCVTLENLCVVAEQLVLPHSALPRQRQILHRLLERVHSPFDYHTSLRPRERPTVLGHVTDGSPYSYLPMAVVQSIRNRTERRRFHVTQPAFQLPDARGSGLIFFTCWPSNPAEVFHRSVTMLHAIWPLLAKERPPTLVPATWSKQFNYWLAPWLASNSTTPSAVQPMAPMPSARGSRLWALHWARTRSALRRYEEEAAKSRAPPRCFARAHVCDFSQEGVVPGVGRGAPWAAMQAVMQHYAPATTQAPVSGSRLRVAFVVRHRRRRLVNIDDLVSRCNRWQPEGVRCTSIDFVGGLPRVASQLRRIDVLVSPHGADAIHALALHQSAWLVEVMPIFDRSNCPCTVFRELLDAEHAVHYLRLSTTNQSYADMADMAMSHRPQAGRERRSMHADLFVPWEAVRAALEAIRAPSASSGVQSDEVRLDGLAAGWRLLTSSGAASEERNIREEQNRNFALAATMRKKRIAAGLPLIGDISHHTIEKRRKPTGR